MLGPTKVSMDMMALDTTPGHELYHLDETELHIRGSEASINKILKQQCAITLLRSSFKIWQLTANEGVVVKNNAKENLRVTTYHYSFIVGKVVPGWASYNTNL